MALGLPNESRHFDEATHMVRLRGHDGAIEASFFIGEEALARLQPGMEIDEAGLLCAFDAHREVICRTAIDVYGRARKGAYDILATEF